MGRHSAHIIDIAFWSKRRQVFSLFLDGTEEPFYCSCKSQPRFKSQKGQQDMYQCSKVENTNGVQAQNRLLLTAILPVMCAASATRRDT